MLSYDLRQLRADALEQLVQADRPLPPHRIARRLFGPRRHEHPEAQAVVRALLGQDERFLETHDGRWSARGAPGMQVPLAEARYAVVDLETTGSVIGVDEVMEVGAVVVQGGKVVESFSSLVSARREIPPWVARLTGIRSETLLGEPSFPDVAGRLAPLLAGDVFVAHDVRFDLPFLEWEFTRHGLLMPVLPGLCTLRLAEVLWPDVEGRSLPELARRFDHPLRKHHRAGEDAGATATVLLAALAETARRGLRTLGDVYAATRRGRPREDADLPLAAEASE